LSSLGVTTHLIECTDHLGGWRTESTDTPWLRDLIAGVETDPRITVHRSTTLNSCEKRPGHLHLTLVGPQGESELSVGTLVVATGAHEHRPSIYGLDESAVARTLREFQTLVPHWKAGHTSPEIPQSILMLQCAGTRDATHCYCSKTCCSDALRNALALKQFAPETSITVFYRDMMTTGLEEALYEQARREGIQFVRYTLESPPRQEGAALTVFDDVLRESITLQADLLVLSTGIIPNPGAADLARLLGVPLDKDGFFKPMNVKSQMMDLSYPGLYLAGSAGGSATFEETIVQGMSAGLRAALFLQRKLHPPLAAAQVNERICSGCGLCVQACPVGARRLREGQAVAEVDPWLCLGCGTCVAVCPNGASSQALYETRGVLSMLEAALG
jgi:heterodisulfide reductase subunit A